MTYTVLQRQVGDDGELRWVSVAAGFKTPDAAERMAGYFKGWVWWGPSDQARRIEDGEEQVP